MPDIRPYQQLVPQIAATAYVDEAATIIGDVVIASQVSIWPGVVLRGDQGSIHIDEQSNVQDGSVIHSTGGWSTTKIGARVTVGHKVILHGCIVEDDCLIGMGAILLDNCRIGRWSIVGAGALVTANTIIPEGSLVLGSPARAVRQITDAEKVKWIQHGCEEYIRLGEVYRKAP